MSTRVDSIEDTHSWAKGGLMIRAGNGQSAPFAAVYRTPANGVVFEWRARFRRRRGRSISVDVANGPVWIKLVRRGNSFAAFHSQDGQRWTRIGEAQTVAMPGAVRAGLAVTSHDVGRRTTAVFSNFNVS